MRTRLRRTRPTLLLAASLATLALADVARAQSLDGRPLRALTANVLDRREHSLEVGFEARWGIRPIPLISTVEGDRIQAPIVRYRLGLGRGEFAVGMPVYQWLNPDDSSLDATSDFGDASFSVTIQALKQKGRRPALATSFCTKLPNASEPTRLGTDETDIIAAIVLSHDGPKHDLRFNVGIGLLGDPSEGSAQEDVLTYAVAGRQGERHALLWEIWGQTSGSDPVRDFAEGTVRLGYAHVGRRVIADISVLQGFVENSGGLGLTAGATFHFGEDR